MKFIFFLLCLILASNVLFAHDLSDYKIDRTCIISNFEFSNYYDNLFKPLPGYKGRVATILKEIRGESRVIMVGNFNAPVWKSDKMHFKNGLVVNKADYSIWRSSSLAGSLNRVLFFDHKTNRGYFYSRHINGLRWIGEGETRAFKVEFSNCQIK